MSQNCSFRLSGVTQRAECVQRNAKTVWVLVFKKVGSKMVLTPIQRHITKHRVRFALM